jgi:hypothetical protein
MFSKVVIASSLTLAAAGTSAVTKSGVQPAQNKKSTATTVASSGVTSSAAITTGAWAEESHTSCSSLDSEPWTTGYNLGKCVGSIGGSSYSTKYTSCEWNADKSTLLVNYEYYTTSAFCSGSSTSLTSTYSGMVDGCDSFADKYQCGTDVGFADYGSPQHIGNWNAGSCGSESDEMEWNVWSYSSCTDSSSCVVASSSYSYKGVCDDADDICFHVDTKIDYKGVEYTFEELKAGKEPECTVPHTPSSKGVVISTSCDKTVRVTDTHLMATTKGFQLAYSLKAGDVLFGDYGKDMCTVKSVEKEKSTQQYFGLNCVHSEVLASGLRASTFGDFHTLPSWYMTYVGGLVGSEAASALGDYIAEWYFQK